MAILTGLVRTVFLLMCAKQRACACVHPTCAAVLSFSTGDSPDSGLVSESQLASHVE